MTGCPRVFTKEQMIAGLKSGKTFVVDRCDAPELPELLEMERAGLESPASSNTTNNQAL